MTINIFDLPQEEREPTIIECFNNIGIQPYTGGIMDYDLVNQKKIIVDGKRIDGIPKLPKDNVFKFRPNDTDYLIIDADGIDISQLEEYYPSIKDTFYTTTTKPTKRHYFVLPPEGLKWPLSSKTKVEGPDTYDLLYYYNLFEGHAYDINPYYSITTKTPQRVSIAEYNAIKEILKKAHTTDPTTGKKPRAANPKLTSLIKEYTASILDGGPALDQTNINFLVRSLITEDTKNKRKLSFDKYLLSNGKPDHTAFNFLAWKVTYTELSHIDRDRFIDAILTDLGFDPTSKLSKQHLDNSIYATLPRFDTMEKAIEEADSIVQIMKETSFNEHWGYVKFLSSKAYSYMQISLDTLEPRLVGENNTPFFGMSKLEIDFQAYLVTGTTKEMIANGLPTVKLINDPFSPRLGYDHKNDIDVYNMAPKSEYYIHASPSPDKPDNIVTRVIHSYFGEYEDFYYHWLAHHMFGEQPPQTCLYAVSGSHEKGRSGKSTVTIQIPNRLIPTATRVSEDVVKSNFSTPPGSSLQVFNDLTHPSVFGEYIYPEIKDGSTGGAPKIINIKYGGQVMVSQSVGYAVSANFYPPIDGEHDRRSWIVAPQHQEGRTSKLTEDEANKLNYMFEGPGKDKYYDELQDLTNYLKYLIEEEPDKYNKELFIEAIKTEYYSKCIGGTFSSRLYRMLIEAPEEIESYVPSSDMPNLITVFRFIMYLNSQHEKPYISIPYGLLGYLLELMGLEGFSSESKARIASTMKLEDGNWKNHGIINELYYHNYDDMKKHQFPQHWAEFQKSNQLKIETTPELIDRYMELIKDFKLADDNINV